MRKINSLSDLLMEELSDLLDAENQLATILPGMAQSSQSATLKTALEDHQAITKEHINRLQDIFSNIGNNPSNRACKAMKGFIADIEDVIADPDKYPSRDTVIIKAAQRMEKFEINGYVSARVHADELGHTKIVELMNKSLNEVRALNFYINELAQGMINAQTLGPSPEVNVNRFISEGNPNF